MSFSTLFDAVSMGALPSWAAILGGIGGNAAGGSTDASGAGPRAAAAVRVWFGPGVWVACDESAGIIEIRNDRLFRRGCEAFCEAFAESAVARHGAHRVDICLRTATCRVAFEQGACDRAELARRITAAIQEATASIGGEARRIGDVPADRDARMPGPARTPPPARRRARKAAGRVVICHPPAPVARSAPHRPRPGRSRTSDMAMAGGSLAMAVAGAVLPGIPTLPFLVLSARHAARVSPNIERLLASQSWCAPILSTDEEPGAFVMDRKAILKMLPIIAGAVAVFLIVQPPLPVVLGLEVAVMAVMVLREMSRTGRSEAVVAVSA